jgi:muramoyltetrapeptide carboxypeptidase
MPRSLNPAATGIATKSLTIALFAPSGLDPDASRALAATRYFESRGHRVVDTINFALREQRFAAADEVRLATLARVVDDPSIDVAIALRGGYGLSRLLPRIDFAVIAKAIGERGLRLVGHSDFTALNLALLATTGASSHAGPMAGFDFSTAPEPFTETHFWRALDGHIDVPFVTHSDDLAVDGPLWGGNLAMIISLIGTPWMPRVDGGILFIEDVSEQPYRVERMLLQLAYAGILGRQRAVVVGDFTEYSVAPVDHGYDMAAALAKAASVAGVPFVTGLPFGHVRRKATLLVGHPATLTVRDGQARLQQSR